MRFSSNKPRASLLLLAAVLSCHSSALAQDPSGKFAIRRLPPVTRAAYEERYVGEVNRLPAPIGDESSEIPSVLDLTWGDGAIRVAPYGAFWGDMLYASRRTSPGPFTLFVPSREEQGEDAVTIDVRRTRLGLDVSGPTVAEIGNAKTSGKIEIDFHGDFVTENRASVLLRHAYWEAQNDEFRVLVGQTWDVISPLYPSTLNYSHGLFAGDIGFRRAQFRAEHYMQLSDSMQFVLQGSLNQDVVTDFRTDPSVRREASDWPVLQARTALSFGTHCDDRDAVTLGFSGHIGETGFDFLTPGPPPLSLPPQDDARFKTWSFNVDLRVPVSDRFGFQGEFFTGANLSSFLGGVGQGICPCLRVPIRSIGGWGEIWYHWTSWLRSHGGFGVDDPRDDDSLFGRTYNQFIFTNVICDVTQRLSTGLELTFWKTLYRETRGSQIPANQLAPSQPGESVTIDWMVKYAF